MTTDVMFSLFIDQEFVAVRLSFLAEFTGTPSDGFTLSKATLIGIEPWMLRQRLNDQGEVIGTVCVDSSIDNFPCNSEETETLACYLKDVDPDPSVTLVHPGRKARRMKLSELLAEQWERDQELQDEVCRTPARGLQNV